MQVVGADVIINKARFPKGTDPYVVVSVGNQTFKTTQKKPQKAERQSADGDDYEALWKERFSFTVHPGDALTVKLMDHDVITRDDVVGTKTLQFNSDEIDKLTTKNGDWVILGPEKKGQRVMIWMTVELKKQDAPLPGPPPPGQSQWNGGQVVPFNPPPPGSLSVAFREAKHLSENLSMNGRIPDSYVRLSVNGKAIAQTRVVPRNDQPVWNEEFYLDPNHRRLEVAVWDASTSECIGTVDIDMIETAKAGRFDHWYFLRDFYGNDSGLLLISFQARGSTSTTQPNRPLGGPRYVPALMRVVIIEGCNLPIDTPYVVMKGNSGQIYKQTSTRNSSNPIWNEVYDFDLRKHNNIELKLHREGDLQPVATCRVRLQAFGGCNEEHWFKLQDTAGKRAGALLLGFHMTNSRDYVRDQEDIDAAFRRESRRNVEANVPLRLRGPN